jgi:hypothetical protein
MKTSDHLEIGRVYTREELRTLFDIRDATINTGTFRPKGHDSVWLFVTENKTPDRTQYRDRLDGDDLYMEGQTARRTDPWIIEQVKVSGKLQIDVLERYADLNDAIPMYCLFNFAEGAKLAHTWQCGYSPVDQAQLACTMTPSKVIRQATKSHGDRTFAWIHQQSETLPWRCFVHCNCNRQLLATATAVPLRAPRRVRLFGRATQRYRELPVEVERGRADGLVTEFRKSFTRRRRDVIRVAS